jgi:hypothetical protein
MFTPSIEVNMKIIRTTGQHSALGEFFRYQQFHWFRLGIRGLAGLAGILSFAFPETMFASGVDANPTIRVRVNNYTQASPSILAGAEREAGRILGKAGLRPVWLGVYYDYVARLARRDDAEFEIPIILGCDIAHEIGHLLLGSESHSASGIMKGHWERGQIRQAVTGTLLFTPEQAKLIQAETQKRMRLQTSAPRGRSEASAELTTDTTKTAVHSTICVGCGKAHTCCCGQHYVIYRCLSCGAPSSCSTNPTVSTRTMTSLVGQYFTTGSGQPADDVGDMVALVVDTDNPKTISVSNWMAGSGLGVSTDIEAEGAE